MSYSKTLAEMIEKSELTLREIAEKCKEYHVKIDPSYISKLQSGKNSPASEDINVAIAKVCDGDPNYLLFEAYMEKAPDIMTDTINNICNIFRDFARSHLSKAPKNSAPILEEIIENMSDWGLLQLVLDKGLGLGLIPLTETKRKAKTLGEDQEIEVLENELFRITMSDNSMNPVIPKGAKIQLDSSANINTGDIVVAEIPNHCRVIRRCILFEDKIFLLPENKVYETKILDRKDIRLFGKVKEVIIEL